MEHSTVMWKKETGAPPVLVLLIEEESEAV